MARRLEYTISTDPSEGIKGLKQFSSAAKKAMKDVDDSTDDTTTSAQKLARVLSGMADDLETEMRQAATAADALGKALGSDLAGRADLDSVVADLHRMGLSFEEITDDAEVLAASLHKLDSVRAKVDVDVKGNAKEDLDRIGDEARDLDGKTVRFDVKAEGLDEITDKIGDLPGMLGEIGGALGPLMAGGGAVAGAGALGGALLIAGNAAADLALEAGTYATLTGATVEDASRLLTVLKSTGLEYNDIADITVQVNQALAQSPELAQRLGIHLDDGKNAAARLLEVIQLNEQGLINMTDASTLFGEEGIRQMARVKLTIDDITRALLDLPEGAIIKPDDVDRAAEMRKEMAKAALEIQAVATDLGQQVVPYMEKAAEAAQLINDAFGTLNFDLPDVAGTDMGSFFTNLIPGVQTLTRIKQGFGLVQSGLQQLGVVGREVDAVFDDFAGGEFADGVDDTADALDRSSGAHERNMFRIRRHREELEKAAEVQEEAAEAYTEWADAAAEANRVLAEGPTVAAGVEGAGKLLDQLFGLTRIASDAEAAYDALGESIKENGYTFDVNNEKGRDNQQVLERLAQSLIPTIAANYANAAGSLETFTGSMDSLKTGVFKQLQDETDLTDRQIRDIIKRLGVFDGSTYSAQFEMLGLEDAESKVALLLPLLETLDVAPDIQKQIGLKIVAGDYHGALTDIETGIANAPDPAVVVAVTPPTPGQLAGVAAGASNTLKQYPATLPVVPFLDTKKITNQAQAFRAFFEGMDTGGTAAGFGAIAGEKGPEILNRRYLTVGPTYVPPGTRVTSRRQTERILRTRGTRGLRRYDSGGTVPRAVTVNISGVVGSSFEVARSVRRAEQAGARLLGTRG